MHSALAYASANIKSRRASRQAWLALVAAIASPFICIATVFAVTEFVKVGMAEETAIIAILIGFSLPVLLAFLLEIIAIVRIAGSGGSLRGTWPVIAALVATIAWPSFAIYTLGHIRWMC